MMFSGILLLCDGCDRMQTGKWLVFGTYDRINVQGPQAVHDLAFYVKMRTDYEGQLELRLSIYHRQSGNANPKPQVSLGVSMKLQRVPGVSPDETPTYELGINVPQATLAVSEEMKILGEDVLMPFDVVLSTNGNEIARTQFSVFFQLKPPVTVTKL